jgi:sorbitol-specific phosphotransferase system component IIBC
MDPQKKLAIRKQAHINIIPVGFFMLQERHPEIVTDGVIKALILSGDYPERELVERPLGL